MDDPFGDRLRWVARHADAARMHALAADERARSAAREAWRRLGDLDRVGRRVQTLAAKRG